MSTDDPSGYLPPLELRGLLNQIADRSGGGGLPQTPVPNLVQTTPGVSASAFKPIGAPTLPSDDPQSIALMIQRMAGELFGGASVVPVPAPQNAMSSLGVASPLSPGVAPMLVPGQQLPGVPSDPSAAAVPQGGAGVPTSVAPASASTMSGPAPTLWGGGADSVPYWAEPGAAGAPSAAMSNDRSTELSNDRSNDRSSREPRGLSTDAGADVPHTLDPGPFSTASIDPLALFGGGGLPEAITIPIVDAFSLGSSPYFLPAPEAVTPDTELDGPRVLPSELRADPRIEQGSLVRDLGGNAFDPYVVRKDFPILEERVHGKRLVWLDNAATTQKPRAVIDRLSAFYAHENSNIHRAAHTLAARATDAYESARETTRKFLNAGSTSEIIFVRGATEGINLVAQSWGRRNVREGDEIVITHLEHHANIVPWQMLCAEVGARLRVAPVDDRGDVILEQYERLLGPRTRLVALPQVSNALGTITPAREMVEIAHRYGALALVDGAQAVSHMPVDVQALDCDFYVFSGHKVFAPTGIGAVFGKRDVLADMPPWQGGGNMIQDVTFERTTYHPAPFRFEAGTGNIADAAGLGAALEYVMKIGMPTIDRYEHDLLGYGTEQLRRVPGLRMIGTSASKAGVLSFVLDGQRTEDVGAALDKEGIAVRSGHHCAQPILRRFGVESTVRASLAFYNVCEDIDALVDALLRLQSHRQGVR